MAPVAFEFESEQLNGNSATVLLPFWKSVEFPNGNDINFVSELPFGWLTDFIKI